VAKKRINPNYLVVLFTVVTPTNMLALTLLQREEKKVKKALLTLGLLTKSVEVHQSKIGQLEKNLKALKTAK
jgi:hypothetical protein